MWFKNFKAGFCVYVLVVVSFTFVCICMAAASQSFPIYTIAHRGGGLTHKCTQLNLLTGLLIWIGEARQNLLISFSEANHDIETVVVFQSKQTIEFPIFGNTDNYNYKYGFKV